MMNIAQRRSGTRQRRVTYQDVLDATSHMVAEVLTGTVRNAIVIISPIRPVLHIRLAFVGLMNLSLVMGCGNSAAAMTEEQVRRLFGEPSFGLGLLYIEDDFGQMGVPVRIPNDPVECIRFLAGNGDGDISAAESAFWTGLCRATLLHRLADHERNTHGWSLDDLIDPVVADRIAALSITINADAKAREIAARESAKKRRTKEILTRRQQKIDKTLAEARARWAAIQEVFPKIEDACARFDAAWKAALPHLRLYQKTSWKNVRACQDDYQVKYQRSFETYIAKLESTEPHTGGMLQDMPMSPFMGVTEIEDVPASIDRHIQRITSSAEQQKQWDQEK